MDPQKNGLRKSVLVVDDESLICWSVVETLVEAGYEVIEAHGAVSAIRAVTEAARPPDVVLLDLHLPDLTDLRLLSTLRRQLPAIPIIIVTAYGSPELRIEAYRLGAVGLIDKPVEMSELAPLVAGALVSRPH